jgi:hypothetical protein
MSSISDPMIRWGPCPVSPPRRWLTEEYTGNAPQPLVPAQPTGLSTLTLPRTSHVLASKGRLGLAVSWEGPEPPWLRSTLEAAVELSGLPENWDSYGARRVAVGAVVAAIDLLLRVMPYAAPPPQVVPMSTGGIQLEWHTGGIDVEVAVRPSGEASALFEDLRTGEEWEGSVAEPRTDLAGALARLVPEP